MRVGIFRGPWETGQVSQDGAVIGFADVEHALVTALAGDARFTIVDLDPSLFVADDPASRLAGLDLVYANCGPLAALLFRMREAAGLSFAIIREVRTLGWIGYAFQEYVAREMQRPGDACTHVAAYSMGLWRRVRPAADRLYYPMLREAQAAPGSPPREPATCGYFSRVSADKGIEYVAPIVARLREAGWPVTRVAICGAVESEALLEGCREALRRAGVAVTCHGELGYLPALRLMEAVDVVLFPSVSNIEASGRVVLEAYQRGKPVIGSDYCAARDVLAPAFRIPLRFEGTATGHGASAFPIARLALDAWAAPQPGAPCFVRERVERYRLNRADTLALVLGGAGPAPDEPAADTPSLSWHWEECRAREASDWCALAHDALRRTWRDRRDLLDLGGAFKRSLLAAGFNPRVSFQAAPTSERNSSYLPEGLRGISS